MRNYRGFDTDNARWEGFEFREGDIVRGALAISVDEARGPELVAVLCPDPEVARWAHDGLYS